MRARCGVGTGDVVAPARGTRAASSARPWPRRAARSRGRRRARSAIDAPTWRLVRHAARARALAGGGFVLDALDADAPAIRRRLDRPLIGREHELARLRDAFARVVAERAPRADGRSSASPASASRGSSPSSPRSPATRHACSPAAARRTARASRTGRCARSSSRPRAIARSTSWRPRSASRRPSRTGGRRRRPRAGRGGRGHRLGVPALIGALARAAAARRRRRRRPLGRAGAARPAARRRRAAARRARPARRASRAPTCSRRAPAGPAASPRQRARARPALARRERGAARRRSTAARLDPDERAADRRGRRRQPAVPRAARRLRRRARPSADALPPALHALLAARLDRLDAGERSALALGAVAGDALRRRLGARARPGHDPRRARAGMRPSGRARPARPRRGRVTARLRFRHALVRDAAYASLAKSARARLHERHADWLAGLGDEVPEADARIGFHLETACRYERGARRPRPGGARDRGRPSARGGRDRRARARRPAAARSASSIAPSRCWAPSAPRAPSSARRSCSALFEAGLDRARRAGGGPRRVDGRGARPAAACSRARSSSASASGSARQPESFDVAERASLAVEQARRRSRSSATTLGLARAAYLMADLAWLAGRPGGVLRARRADARVTRARAERLRRRDGAHLHGLVAWSRGRARCRPRSRAATRWRARRPASAPPS